MSKKGKGTDKNGRELRPGQGVKVCPITDRLYDFVGRVTEVGDWISRVRNDETGNAYACYNRDIEIQ